MNTNKLIVLLCMVSGLLPPTAKAFEYDGLKSGMSMPEVQQTLLKNNYSISETPAIATKTVKMEPVITAVSPFKPKLALYFCHDRLFSLSEQLPGEFDGMAYSRLLAETISKHRMPIFTWAIAPPKNDARFKDFNFVMVMHGWLVKPNEGLRLSYQGGKEIAMIHDSLDYKGCGVRKMYQNHK